MTGVQSCVVRKGGKKTKEEVGARQLKHLCCCGVCLFVFGFAFSSFWQFPGVQQVGQEQQREKLLPGASGRTAGHALLMGIEMPCSETRSEVTVDSSLETTRCLPVQLSA